VLEDVKSTLRIRNNALDTEVTDLIAACKADLKLAGINQITDTDPLIKRAVTLYCKAELDINNADRYKASYQSLKISLSLAGDYNAVV
jgi:hypothetical protein